jgi:hypothetical protein
VVTGFLTLFVQVHETATSAAMFAHPRSGAALVDRPSRVLGSRATKKSAAGPAGVSWGYAKVGQAGAAAENAR